MRVICITLGGALGALARYAMHGWAEYIFGDGLSVGVTAVNLAGSLLIGMLFGLCESIAVSENIRIFLFVGFLGSFTTFSSFSLDNLNLLRDGRFGFFCGNVFVNVAGGLFLAYIGYSLLQHLVKLQA